MKILFVTSECAPFSKSGGLADVAFSLPPELAATGNEIAIITPLYQCVKENYGDTLKTEWTGSISLGGKGALLRTAPRRTSRRYRLVRG